MPPSQQHVQESSQKSEALNSKKRKAPSSGEAQTGTADVFDSVAEHAEKLAKMKQKKQKSMKEYLDQLRGQAVSYEQYDIYNESDQAGIEEYCIYNEYY